MRCIRATVQAVELFKESLTLNQHVSAQRVRCLYCRAIWRHLRGLGAKYRAVQLFGAVATCSALSNWCCLSSDRIEHDHYLSACVPNCDPVSFEAAWRRNAMSLEQVSALAMELIQRLRDDKSPIGTQKAPTSLGRVAPLSRSGHSAIERRLRIE